MALSPSVKSRKADALHNRLVKAYRGHDFALVIMTWVEGDDIVVRVISDKAPALQVREWLNVELRGHDLFRIADRIIGNAIGAEIKRELEHAEWLAACARMSH